MRITSQMMLSQYTSDVSDAYASMSKAMRHAYDYRAFDLPSDDPLAASQTFEIHSEISQNSDYASNISNVKGEVTSGETVLQNIDSMLSSANSTTTLQAVSGTMNASNRSSLADQLLSYRDSIVSQLNTKYADSYVFSGSGSGSQPFELVESSDTDHPENDKLYYRGVNVDTGLTKTEETTAAGYTQTINDSSTSTADKTTAQTALDTLNATGTSRLKELSSDKVYVDIGLGMTVDASGNVNDQSAYNKSMPGISYVGYGEDSNGTPQNVCSLLSKIAGVLKGSSSETSLSTSELSTITKYTTAFSTTQSKCQAGQTELGNKLKFISSTSDYISSTSTNLSERDNDVEYVDSYDAIEDYYQQLFCYNAALKVGGEILQQSLMDYIK